MSDTTLKQDVIQVVDYYRQLESTTLHRTSQAYRELALRAIDACIEALRKIHMLDLWSDNETAEDLTNIQMWYLNLDFYVAQILDYMPINPDRVAALERIGLLKATARKYVEFLILIDRLGVQMHEMPVLKRLVKGGNPGTMVLDNVLSLSESTSDRSSKIEIHRAARAFEADFQETKTESGEVRAKKADSDRELVAKELAYHSIVAWENLFETAREYNMLRGVFPAELQPAVRDGKQLPYFLPDDVFTIPLEDISYAPKHSKLEPAGPAFTVAPDMTLSDIKELNDARLKKAATLQDNSIRIEPGSAASRSVRGAALVDSKGRPLRPFTLQPSRAAVAARVQGTGQYLPTMSVEEFVEEELRNGGMAQSAAPEKEEDEDDARGWDAETDRQRRWDDFVEANPRGSGNTMNRG